MTVARSKSAAYTLVELLIVIALIGVLATVILPRLNPAIHDDLVSSAQVLAADLHYARSLAVTNNSQYRLTFDTTQNRYVLDHSGSNTLLEALPVSPFKRNGDPPDQQTCDFDEIPHTGPTVQLVGLRTASSAQAVTDVEFGPLGGTVRSSETIIWLGCGAGENRRYISVSVDPITGLATVGDMQETAPPAAGVPAAIGVVDSSSLTTGL